MKPPDTTTSMDSRDRNSSTTQQHTSHYPSQQPSHPDRSDGGRPVFYISNYDDSERTTVSHNQDSNDNSFETDDYSNDNVAQNAVSRLSGEDLANEGIGFSEDNTNQCSLVQDRLTGSSQSVPIPIVNRSNSLVTECRRAHSAHLMVRCRLSSSCPAAFSTKWPQVVPRSSNGRHAKRFRSSQKSSGEKRRHTVGPATAKAQLIEFQQRQRALLYPDQQDEAAERDFEGRSRSHSDSELQYMLMWKVGKELKRMSDEFNFDYTGKKLSPVNESSDDEDSDDEM